MGKELYFSINSFIIRKICIIFAPSKTNLMKRILYLLAAIMLCSCMQAQSKRALLIGISNYSKYDFPPDHEWHNIHGANDVRLLVPTLTKQGFTIDTLTNAEATAVNIRQGLENLEKTAEPGDMVYIHLSGHGQPVEDADKDEKDGWDEAFIPVDAPKKYVKGKYEGENHILDDELNVIFTKIRKKIGPQGFIYVVVDACHAGTAYRDLDLTNKEIIRGTSVGFGPKGKEFKKPDSSKRTAQTFKIPKGITLADICILEACRADEYNRELRRKGSYFGPLSFYIDKVIQDMTLDKDIGWIDKVKDFYSKDSALQGEQHIVIETSL